MTAVWQYATDASASSCGSRAATDTWPPLSVGTALEIIKLRPNGTEATRYPGRVLASSAPWVAVEAWWVSGRVELDGLAFSPGDRLVEYFSPMERFNVFAVSAPAGKLRGWYANVTYPPRLDLMTTPASLTWHDLYLDLVGLPNGNATIRDEDELADADIAHISPDLYAAILEAKDEIWRRFQTRTYPFHDPRLSTHG